MTEQELRELWASRLREIADKVANEKAEVCVIIHDGDQDNLKVDIRAFLTAPGRLRDYIDQRMPGLLNNETIVNEAPLQEPS